MRGRTDGAKRLWLHEASFCSYPSMAISYFAVDIATDIFLYTSANVYMCPLERVSTSPLARFIALSSVVSRGCCERGSEMAEITKYYFNEDILELNPEL